MFLKCSPRRQLRLGGDDFDHRVVCWALEGVAGQGEGILTPKDKRRLTLAARKAREALTDTDAVVLKLELSDGRTIEKMLARAALTTWSFRLCKRQRTPWETF